jgi:hypothetical protein
MISSPVIVTSEVLGLLPEGQEAFDMCQTVFLADDPAIVEALKDAEDLQKLKELLGAKTGNEIFVWHRNSRALEALEGMIDNTTDGVLLMKYGDKSFGVSLGGNFLAINEAFKRSAPDLVTAIEKAMSCHRLFLRAIYR